MPQKIAPAPVFGICAPFCARRNAGNVSRVFFCRLSEDGALFTALFLRASAAWTPFRRFSAVGGYASWRFARASIGLGVVGKVLT